MVPGAFSTVTPWRAASPERGRTWPSVPRGSAMAMPVGICARAAGRDRHRRIRRHRGEQIEAGGAGALIGRQRQVGAVRQPHDLDVDAFIVGSPSSAAAMRCDQRARDVVLRLRRPVLDAVAR